MKPLDLVSTLRCGALAGLVGGVVFGAAMIELGMLPTIAALARADSAVVGFIVHMMVAAVIGMGFSLLVRHQRPGVGETLFWGMSYGTFWWFLGPLTLLPLFLGEGLAWQAPLAREAFPSLLGHVLYGASTGLALLFFQRQEGRAEAWSIHTGIIARGILAGLVGTWLLGVALEGQGLPLAFADLRHGEANPLFWSELLAIGAIVGVSFSLLYLVLQRDFDRTYLRG